MEEAARDSGKRIPGLSHVRIMDENLQGSGCEKAGIIFSASCQVSLTDVSTCGNALKLRNGHRRERRRSGPT